MLIIRIRAIWRSPYFFPSGRGTRLRLTQFCIVDASSPVIPTICERLRPPVAEHIEATAEKASVLLPSPQGRTVPGIVFTFIFSLLTDVV